MPLSNSHSNGHSPVVKLDELHLNCTFESKRCQSEKELNRMNVTGCNIYSIIKAAHGAKGVTE
jgi:hypothetical protein